MQRSFPLRTLPLSCQSSGVEASDWPEYWPLIGQDEMDHVTPYNTLLESVTLQNHGFCSYTREMQWRVSRNDTFFALMVTSF